MAFIFIWYSFLSIISEDVLKYMKHTVNKQCKNASKISLLQNWIYINESELKVIKKALEELCAKNQRETSMIHLWKSHNIKGSIIWTLSFWRNIWEKEAHHKVFNISVTFSFKHHLYLFRTWRVPQLC